MPTASLAPATLFPLDEAGSEAGRPLYRAAGFTPLATAAVDEVLA
ncbi:MULTISPECIES: hypothetical protein [unclassified Burkholderia]|nr:MULTISPECIES: hypothetical protein [unclassified Burkholderia]MDN7426207.1 hypothetical protein [Burkholderia sp. AU45388]